MENYIDEKGINRDPALLKSRSKQVGKMVGPQYIIDEITGVNKYNQNIYNIRCLKCGHVYTDALIADIVRKLKKKEGCNHGADHLTYNKWKVPRIGKIYKNMKERCYNKNSINYQYYGEEGKGICNEWLNDHTKFEEWALANGYQDGYEINRKDYTKGYSPDNCEWVPPGVNSKFDKRNTRVVFIDGKPYTGRDIDKKFGLRNGYTYTYMELHGLQETQKWVDDIIGGRVPPPNAYSHTKFYSLDGCYNLNLADWSRLTGIKYTSLYSYFNSKTELEFNKMLRTAIVDNVKVINVFGVMLTLKQVSKLSGMDEFQLRLYYIMYGSEFLFQVIKNNVKDLIVVEMKK